MKITITHIGYIAVKHLLRGDTFKHCGEACMLIDNRDCKVAKAVLTSMNFKPEADYWPRAAIFIANGELFTIQEDDLVTKLENEEFKAEAGHTPCTLARTITPNKLDN